MNFNFKNLANGLAAMRRTNDFEIDVVRAAACGRITDSVGSFRKLEIDQKFLGALNLDSIFKINFKVKFLFREICRICFTDTNFHKVEIIKILNEFLH